MAPNNDFKEQHFMQATRRANRARALAHVIGPRLRDLIPGAFSSAPKVIGLVNQGWMNFTLLVEVSDENKAYILRLSAIDKSLSRPADISPSLAKESYVLHRLERLNVAPRLGTPPIGLVTISMPGEGECDFSFLLQEYLPFRSGSAREVVRDRAYALRQLGEYLKIIHVTKVDGFGLDFSLASNRFVYDRFSDYIESRATGVSESNLDSNLKDWLLARLISLASLKTEPLLFHRDVLANWGNFLIDGDSRVQAIIDWEFAGSGAPLQHELASMIYAQGRDGVVREQTDRDLASVLSGYGVTLEEYRDVYERDTETLVLLSSVEALHKFDRLRRQEGALDREPWRRVFAERARESCRLAFQLDSTFMKARRIAA
jgi:aminoglycoside phosphotransferase (APT) family kinase protein